MHDQNDPISRRTVLRATGAAAALGVGAAGSAAGAPGCVTTSTSAPAYRTCPATSHVTTLSPGRSGFVMDTCEDYGVTYKLVNFDCSQQWWVQDDDLEPASDCYC